jgi:hypothetical protein
MLTGKWVAGIIATPIWALLVLVTSGIAHIFFVIIAWIMISKSQNSKEIKNIIKEMREAKSV